MLASTFRRPLSIVWAILVLWCLSSSLFSLDPSEPFLSVVDRQPPLQSMSVELSVLRPLGLMGAWALVFVVPAPSYCGNTCRVRQTSDSECGGWYGLRARKFSRTALCPSKPGVG